MWRDKCEKRETVSICEEQTTLKDRIDSVFQGNLQEWNKYTQEWDEARHKLRRLGGLE